MAKLTSRQTNELDFILSELRRAQKFLMSDPVVVGKKAKPDATLGFAPNTPSAVEAGLYLADGVVLITKDYGSDLTGFSIAERYLSRFIEQFGKE